MILFKISNDIPNWLAANTHYLTIMGSEAYGCSQNKSDKDYYGICVPPVGYIFPHTQGLLDGFDSIPRFEQWQKHHIDVHKDGSKICDFQVFSIVKFFRLAASGNANVLDCIFTPTDCIHHITSIGHLIRDNRKKFLSKRCWHTFRGYAASQYKKLKNKEYQGGRKEIVEADPEKVDRKFLYHTIRLLLEVEQIVEYGDIDLRRDRELYKAIRSAAITLEEIQQTIERLLNTLDAKFAESKLPNEPDHSNLKELLLKCLETHYGSIDKLIQVNKTLSDEKLERIREIVNG
jgi:predicted nucleotidyltransferase